VASEICVGCGTSPVSTPSPLRPQIHADGELLMSDCVTGDAVESIVVLLVLGLEAVEIC
jgi:hypothetical protein